MERSKVTVNLLVFSWGEVPYPPDMLPPNPRKDGQPDRRYKAGRVWWRRFEEMERDPAQMRAYRRRMKAWGL